MYKKVLLLLMTIFVFRQAAEASQRGFGIGIIVGEPTGISDGGHREGESGKTSWPPAPSRRRLDVGLSSLRFVEPITNRFRWKSPGATTLGLTHHTCV